MPRKTAGNINWFDMEETPYRASQLCRVIGNPKAYQILKELRRLGQATPSDLSELIDRSMSDTCITLKTLREVHLVRYQRVGKNAIHTLKHKDVGETMDVLEALVLRIRRQ